MSRHKPGPHIKEDDIREACGYLSDYADEIEADAKRHDIDEDGAEKDRYRANDIRGIIKRLQVLNQ